MTRVAGFLAVCVAIMSAVGMSAQQADITAPGNNLPAVSQPVPRLIMLGGELRDPVGKPLSGPVDIHFSIYKEQADAVPLWQETQTLQLDEQGHYTVLLGGMQPNGLPLELFTTGEARWLGVAAANLPEQPRTLLVSVPYALKANDAEMLGGKPASAYMLAPPAETTTSSGAASSGGTQAGAPAGPASQNLKPGTSPKPYATPIATNYIPVFTNNSGALGSSVIYQSGSNIGVGTLTPQAALDVNGKARVAYTGFGGLTLTGSQQSSFVLTNAAGAGGFNLGRSLSSDNGQNFFVYDRAAGATRLFLDASGNLGIGTTAPAATLHVNGKARVAYTGYAGLTLTGSQQSSVVLTNAAGTAGFSLGRSLGSDNSQNFFVFDRAAAATRLYIDSSGNVGIGTTGPAQKLDVLGNIKSSGQLLSTVTTGTAPLQVSSTTVVANLNADLLDGLHAGNFATVAGNNFTGNESITGNVSVVASASGATGLTVQATDLATSNTAINGLANGTDGVGVVGQANLGSSAAGIWGISSGGLAGLFSGNVNVTGTLSAATKQFKIDHPLEPANKFLVHASVESSELKTIYDGSVILDANGEALVRLPSWFQALNGDFRYQLTCVGGYAPVYVAQKIQNNQFKIAGGTAGLEVDWQVTGVRHDAYARAHPLGVEIEKPAAERGYFLHPELFGQTPQRGLEWATHAGTLKNLSPAQQSQ